MTETQINAIIKTNLKKGMFFEMAEIFNLWEKVPGYNGGHFPTIEYYKAETKKGDGAVIIFPGGGYRGRAEHEGKGYAEYLSACGIDSFVVQYRVSPDRFPYPLLDARRAVRFVRANAEKFGIDPDKIAVMGSSAGGHLAALVSTYLKPVDGEGVDALDGICFRPNAQILCYPVIDYEGNSGSFNNLLGENAKETANDYTPYLICDEKTPKMFLWHTAEDDCVNVINSYRYAIKLREYNIPVEMHIYPHGGHGLGLAPNYPYVQSWAEHLVAWLKLNEYIE